MTAPLTHHTAPARVRDHAVAPGAQPGTRSPTQDRRSVAWFVALNMALVALAFAATGAFPALVPFALAIVPAFVALALAAREGPGAARTLFRDTFRGAIRPAWYLVVALPVLGAVATVAIGIALGYDRDSLFGAVLPAVLIVPLVVLIPAFAEELAWRGYATQRLLSSVSPLSAALLLAVPWTLIHLVLLIPGGMNEGAAVWPTIVMIVAYSVLLTWIYVGSGSVLVAALVHTGLNGVVPLMSGIDSDASWAIRAVVAAAIAIAVVAFGGFRRIAPGLRSRR